MAKSNTGKKGLTLKALSKSNVWDLQENDVFRIWEAAEKESDLKDNARHYIDIIKSAFEVEEIRIDKPEVIKKYEARDFKVGQLRTDESSKIKLAIKKRAIKRVTDLMRTSATSRRHSFLRSSTVTSVAVGIAYRRASRTLSRVVSTYPPLPFPRTVCTKRAVCARRN